jgi:hypothetical protein
MDIINLLGWLWANLAKTNKAQAGSFRANDGYLKGETSVTALSTKSLANRHDKGCDKLVTKL